MKAEVIDLLRRAYVRWYLSAGLGSFSVVNAVVKEEQPNQLGIGAISVMLLNGAAVEMMADITGPAQFMSLIPDIFSEAIEAADALL